MLRRWTGDAGLQANLTGRSARDLRLIGRYSKAEVDNLSDSRRGDAGVARFTNGDVTVCNSR